MTEGRNRGIEALTFETVTVILHYPDGGTEKVHFSEINRFVYDIEKREIESRHGNRCYEPTGRRTITIFGTVESEAEKKYD